jgi:protein-disulfide isomerase
MSPPRLITLAFLALTSLGASCSGNNPGTEASGASPSNPGAGGPSRGPRVETLAQVDVSRLTRAERRIWVDLVNDLLSPCGEPVSVGRCAAESQGCRTCVPAARYLVRLIGEGYERQEVEELYAARYAREEPVTLDLQTSPTRGSPMAPITVVAFSDFECPYCGRAHSTLQQVIREFDGRVRLVFKHFPLSGHPRAAPAARAALAAGNQGKFWEMHDLLFEHQRELEDDDIDAYAQQLGLDMEQFRRDLMSPELQRRIDSDRAEGQRVGVEGTPTLFVNGRMLEEPPSALPAYIREELDQL